VQNDMQIYKIDSNDYDSLYKKLGTENTGAKILAKKSQINTLYIKDLHTGAANILKQDALSIGADLAVPRGTILNRTKTVDAILIGSNKHLEILSNKELSQPFGLKNLAKSLKSFINTKQYDTKIMGVINANEDSFYDKSRFSSKSAITKINDMIKDGANIIDIGAVSSKPGSKPIGMSEELNRIKDICDTIKEEKLYEKVDFSIDSYTPEVIQYALNSKFKIVNDITGLSCDKVAKLVATYDATVVIMHKQGDTFTMQDDPTYDNVILQIDDFFTNKIEKAKQFGINKIVLDTGIGFGKTLKHNLELLKHQEHFKHFGYELLIGASRKSMIEQIVPNTPIQDRLSGTLAIHLNAINKGVSIIRCHDVKEHFQAIKVYNSINQQQF
jgi:dihydropteroate synthase